MASTSAPIGFSGAKHLRTDGKHEDSAAPNSMVLDNLWSIAGYFRALRDSRPTANEMGKLVFHAAQPHGDPIGRTPFIGRFEAGHRPALYGIPKMTPSDQETCGVVVVRPASSFRSGTGSPRMCSYENRSRGAGNRKGRANASPEIDAA